MFRIPYERTGYIGSGHVQLVKVCMNCREPPVSESFKNKDTGLKPKTLLKNAPTLVVNSLLLWGTAFDPLRNTAS